MSFSNNFPESLLKGRIAETVFELMFREEERFDVIPLGYEHITPELAQYQHISDAKKVIDNIRNIPDFALVTTDKKSVYLVEVKFRRIYLQEEIHQMAQKVHSRWDPAWLFLATPEAFYFSPCSSVFEHQGNMEKLDERWIPDDRQAKYLDLIKKFELAGE